MVGPVHVLAMAGHTCKVKYCLINTFTRTPIVINNMSCKSEYITQPPSLAFGLGLDQWENM